MTRERLHMAFPRACASIIGFLFSFCASRRVHAKQAVAGWGNDAEAKGQRQKKCKEVDANRCVESKKRKKEKGECSRWGCLQIPRPWSCSAVGALGLVGWLCCTEISSRPSGTGFALLQVREAGSNVLCCVCSTVDYCSTGCVRCASL